MAEVKIGIIADFSANSRIAGIELTAPLRAGDNVRVKGQTTDFRFVVESIQVDNAAATEAKTGKVSLELPKRARRGDSLIKFYDDTTIQGIVDRMVNYQVAIRVESLQGICLAGHKVGDEWTVKGRDDRWRCPSMCIFAFVSLYPSIQMLMYGGSFPWEPDREKVLAPCPDSRNLVVFELRRMPKA